MVLYCNTGALVLYCSKKASIVHAWIRVIHSNVRRGPYLLLADIFFSDPKAIEILRKPRGCVKPKVSYLLFVMTYSVCLG